MMVQSNYTDQEIKEARTRLWYMGNLTWKLDPTQKEIYDFIKNIKQKTAVINCARRLGKSFLLTIIAIEQCLKKEKSIIKFLQPEQKMIRVNIRPIMDKILEDCPPDLRPAFKTQDNIYVFPNGSEIQLAGTDNGNHEKLRGGDSDICIVDEAAFVKTELQYIVRSVLLPTTMLTRGKILLSSTSPKEAEHDFAKYMESAELSNTLIKKTLHDALKDNEGLDNPRFTKEILEEIIAEYPGGEKSDDFRRECLCEIITDGDNSVVPEFTIDVQQETIKEWPRPAFCSKYVSMDIGFKDLTVVLFGYYDFDNAVLVIEDEIVMNGPQMTTAKLAEAILNKERELWTDSFTGEFHPPQLRVSDNNLILINDLQRLHGITFLPTAKDNKDAAINNMRMLIGNYQVYINPRCKTLISHLKHATWNKNRTEFVRSPDKGHYDACFLPNSKVLTRDGLKNIQDIIIGDEVLTHKNRFKKVTNVMNSHFNGNIKNIKVAGRDIIKCTPDHTFYSSKTFKCNDGNLTGQKMIDNPSWIPSKDLVKGQHRVYIPSIDEEKFEITKELCFLYGYYVAEGNLSGNKHGIEFAGHIREEDVKYIIEKAVHDTFGTGQKGISKRSIRRHKTGECKPRQTQIRRRVIENCQKLIMTCSTLWNKLKILGKSDYKKFPDFISKLNKEQSLYMLSGYLFGDGHFSAKGIKANTISYSIRNGIDILARKLEYIGNFTYQNKKIFKNQYWWNLDQQQSINLINEILDKDDLRFIFKNKLMHPIESINKYHISSNFKRIMNISEEYYNGIVYNLEVEEDNSYTVEGVAVHNCDSLAYMARNVDYNRNPYPSDYRRKLLGQSENVFINPYYKEDKPMAEHMGKIFKIGKSLKKS